ncbi:MAG: cadherin repeat domain-containing protein, partial [Sphaerospermopsis kisseleviana]
MRTTGSDGLYFDQPFTIAVTNVNETPTNITLSNSNIAENQAIGTLIGNINTTDPDAGNTFTYSLVTGTGSTDNASFSIAGNQLQANAVFDFETRNTYNIRVRTTDQGGLFFEQPLTVNVNNDPSDDPSITLAVSPSSVNEDGTTNLVYTFTRNGSTTNALTVKYGVAGTATFNTDYTQTGAASFTSTTGT